MITFLGGPQHVLSTLVGSALDAGAGILPLYCNNGAVTCNNVILTCNATTYQP